MTSPDKVEILLLIVICAGVLGALAWGVSSTKPSDNFKKLEMIEHELIEMRGEVQALKAIIARDIP